MLDNDEGTSGTRNVFLRLPRRERTDSKLAAAGNEDEAGSGVDQRPYHAFDFRRSVPQHVANENNRRWRGMQKVKNKVTKIAVVR